MHKSALQLVSKFFDVYAKNMGAGIVADIGANDDSQAIRKICPSNLNYIGVDCIPGKNVDVVLDDPYKLTFESNSVDIVISSSCFEHSDMFWLAYLEILRVLKPGGLFYLNVPSNGPVHRFPTDCWRFYPDSGNALVKWAQRNSYDPLLLESFVAPQDEDFWNDFVAIFVKDKAAAGAYGNRLTNVIPGVVNALINGGQDFVNPKMLTEDHERLVLINRIVRHIPQL